MGCEILQKDQEIVQYSPHQPVQQTMGKALCAKGQASPGLLHAYETLNSGCAFFIRSAEDQPQSLGPQARYAFHRLMGNRLRELDRFLSVVLDEIVLMSAISGQDALTFSRWRNTARKLAKVEQILRTTTGDAKWLAAIGRICACLHHCGGKIHDAGLLQDVTMISARAEAGYKVMPPLISEPLMLCPVTIYAIGGFYHILGDRLVAQAVLNPTRDFPSDGGTARIPEAGRTRM
ncbi:MAG: hypothetical protein E2598_12475 [Sphingobium sp.]|nr:hypothetical protein [Sphingobium sp.]